MFGIYVIPSKSLYCARSVFPVYSVNRPFLHPEKRLLNAIKDIEIALNKGTAFVDKRDNTKLVIHYNGLLYVICISNNPQELTYLNTLFKPDKKYLKTTLKNRYKKVDINK